ncbi:hypothetical protein Droror1_Dr00027695 [Drosera rotundifolia]
MCAKLCVENSVGIGLGEYAEKVFSEMSERRVVADCGSIRAMVEMLEEIDRGSWVWCPVALGKETPSVAKVRWHEDSDSGSVR